MSRRDFPLRPSRKQRLEDSPADLAVQLTYAVNGSANAKGEIGHVERLGQICAVTPPESEQVLERDGKLFVRVRPKVLFHQVRRKTVEARINGCMGCEKIAGTSYGQGQIERSFVVGHVRPGSLKNAKRGVPFIQMTNLRLQAQSTQKPPPSTTQDKLLLQAQYR